MTSDKTYVVVGATGDVGRGVTRALVAAGARVIAVSRSAEKLDALKSELGQPGALDTLPGSVATEDSAIELRSRIVALAPRPDGIIVSVNAPAKPTHLRQLDSQAFLQALHGNLLTHFVAVKTLTPMLGQGGQYIAIGGGMADWVIAGFGAMSACQAAQRAMLKAFDAEQGENPPLIVRELMLHSMIAGASNRGQAQPNWITDEDVGRHVALMLDNPQAFTETVVNLKSRKQAGQLPAAT